MYTQYSHRTGLLLVADTRWIYNRPNPAVLLMPVDPLVLALIDTTQQWTRTRIRDLPVLSHSFKGRINNITEDWRPFLQIERIMQLDFMTQIPWNVFRSNVRVESHNHNDIYWKMNTNAWLQSMWWLLSKVAIVQSWRESRYSQIVYLTVEDVKKILSKEGLRRNSFHCGENSGCLKHATRCLTDSILMLVSPK